MDSQITLIEVSALNSTQEMFLAELWKRARRSEGCWIATVPDTEVKLGDSEVYDSLVKQGYILVEKLFRGNLWDQNRPYTLRITLLNPAYPYQEVEQKQITQPEPPKTVADTVKSVELTDAKTSRTPSERRAYGNDGKVYDGRSPTIYEVTHASRSGLSFSIRHWGEMALNPLESSAKRTKLQKILELTLNLRTGHGRNDSNDAYGDLAVSDVEYLVATINGTRKSPDNSTPIETPGPSPPRVGGVGGDTARAPSGIRIRASESIPMAAAPVMIDCKTRLLNSTPFARRGDG